MGKDAIVNFTDNRGITRRKPILREALTDEQIEQIRFARSEGVSWRAISIYFKEECGMDYGESTWKGAFADGF